MRHDEDNEEGELLEKSPTKRSLRVQCEQKMLYPALAERG
jgi:hypothetical protein